jgi:hypothetical protein
MSRGRREKEMMEPVEVFSSMFAVYAGIAVMMAVIAAAMYDPKPVPYMDGHY